MAQYASAGPGITDTVHYSTDEKLQAATSTVMSVVGREDHLVGPSILSIVIAT